MLCLHLLHFLRRYGSPSDFVTISPNATDEPWVLSMSSRGQDWKPRVLWTEKSTSFRARRKHTERFPATCARFYDRLLRNVFLFVFGIYVDRKSEVLEGEAPGIVKGDGHGFVGFIRALFNATEAQGPSLSRHAFPESLGV